MSDTEWVHLQGKLLLFGEIQKVIIFLEGPPAGTDILVNSFTVATAKKVLSSPPPSLQVGLKQLLHISLLFCYDNQIMFIALSIGRDLFWQSPHKISKVAVMPYKKCKL